MVENLDGEEWKNIAGYEGLYEVSNCGRVKNLNYNHTGQERLLKPETTRNGYLRVQLYKDRQRKKFRVHRLVAQAFVKGYFEGAVIDHTDTNRGNNHWSNLKWVTNEENANNPLTKAHVKKASKMRKWNGIVPEPTNKRSVIKRTLNGNIVKVYDSIAAATIDGFGKTSIWKCCNGLRMTHKGYIWQYLD